MAGACLRDDGQSLSPVARNIGGESCAGNEMVSRNRGKEGVGRVVAQRTAARRQWVCERLCMGEASAVTRAMGIFKTGRDAKVERMKKKLEELSGEA